MDFGWSNIFGFGSYGIQAAVQAITYWLSNNLNTVASVPSDGTKDATFSRGGSKAYIPTWDATSGLVITEVPVDTVAVEGMRISYDTDEGATLGSELITNAVDREFSSDTGYWSGSGTISGGTLNYNLFSSTGKYRASLITVGKYYQLTYEITSYTSGVFAPWIGYTVTPGKTSVGVHTVVGKCTIDTALRLYADTSFFGSIDNVSIKEITPTFVNSVSSADSTKLTPTKTVDVNGTSQEVFVEVDARQSSTAVASESFARTPTASPHNYYYQNQTLASPASTSLVPPLRNSDGQYYEELVKNGGFDVDAEWTKSAGWTISGGSLVATSVAAFSATQQNIGQESGKSYAYSFTASGVTGLGYPRVGSTNGSVIVDGSNSGIITASDSINFMFFTISTFSATIDDISVYECVSATDSTPTNVLDGGRRASQTNYLLNSDAPATQTTGSLATGWYTLWATGTGTATVSAGTATIDTTAMGDATGGTDGSYIWFQVTGAGTVTVTEAGTLDTFDLIGGCYLPQQAPHIATTTGSVQATPNVSTSVLWSYAGRYTNMATATQNHLTGILHEPSATNYLLNSGTPANQTTGSIGTGTYTLWVDDDATGSVSATDNTATSDAAGQSASAGTPLTFTVSSAGTVDIAVTGDVTYFQLENSSVPTSYIPTTTGSVQRNATSETVANPLPSNNFAIRGHGMLADISSIQTILQTGSSGDDTYVFFIYTNSSFIIARNVTASGNQYNGKTFASESINDNDVFNWGVAKTSNGLRFYLNGSAGDFLSNQNETWDLTPQTSLFIGSGANTAPSAISNSNGSITDIQVYTGPDLETWASDVTWSTL